MAGTPGPFEPAASLLAILFASSQALAVDLLAVGAVTATIATTLFEFGKAFG